METPAATPTDTARLFFGFWPDSATVDALVAWREDQEMGEARLTPPENFHVTLHFMGQVPRALIPGLIDSAAALPYCAARAQLLEPDLWHGGIAVIGVDASESLREFRERLGEALRRHGLATDARPWSPHVTIARKATSAPRGPGPRSAWDVTRFRLVESSRRRYAELASFSAA